MSNLPAVNPTELGNALVAAKSRISMDAGDQPFLRLLKSGEWVYSADDVEVQEDSLWAVNPSSINEGYAAWGKGELLGEEMAPMAGVPVLATSLPDVGAKWTKQIAFVLKCLNGEDAGTQVLYKTTSKGGLKAFNKLLSELIEQIEKDGTHIVPVITLEMDSYKHKEYGKIYTPIFNVKDWLDFGGLKDTDEDSADDAPEAAAEPAPEEAAPAKRRRAIAK